MICPICQAHADCKETRQEGSVRSRRYWCPQGHKFKTVEQLDLVFTDADIKEMRLANLKRARDMMPKRDIAPKRVKKIKAEPLVKHVAQPPARPKFTTMEML